MRKNVVIVLAALIAVFGFTGCPSPVDNVTVPENPWVKVVGSPLLIEGSTVTFNPIGDKLAAPYVYGIEADVQEAFASLEGIRYTKVGEINSVSYYEVEINKNVHSTSIETNREIGVRYNETTNRYCFEDNIAYNFRYYFVLENGVWKITTDYEVVNAIYRLTNN